MNHKFPFFVNLFKIKTREDTEYPQEEKYPSGETIRAGYVFEHTVPKVGEPFYLWENRTFPSVRTSIVESVDKDKDGNIIFTTLNSKYKLIPR